MNWLAQRLLNWLDRALSGHPRALAFLFGTEAWERFSYYGMRALLTLYLTKYILLPSYTGHVAGLATLKSVFEWFTGPLDTQPFSSLIFGTYTSLVYLTPIAGGLIADRVLGQRRTVVIGAVLMAFGHFMMAFEALLLPALLLLILGNGAFKPNISTQVGELYAEGDPLRDRAFSIFYFGINLGAMFSPLISGTLGERVGWHWGFGAAGVGMLIGLAIYLRGLRELPPDELQKEKAAHTEHAPLTALDWQAIGALLILFLPNVLFWAAYEQQGNTIALWIDKFTDRTVNLYFWQVEIPASVFQSVNPAMILAFTPFVVGWWGWLAQRGREPATVTKLATGCFVLALSYVFLAGIALHTSETDKSGLPALFMYFAILTLGELYLSPVGLSLVSKVAPAKLLSLMMGVWLASAFLGNFMAGWLGSFWEGMHKAEFFLMIAAVPALAGLFIALLNKPLRRILHH